MDESGRRRMKLSMGSWSFAFGPYATEPKGLFEIAEKLSAAGFDGIELSGYAPHATLESLPAGASRAELKRRLGDLGLGLSGYSADLGDYNPLDPDKRSAYVDQFRRLIELCADLYSPMLRLDTVSAPGAIRTRDYETSFEHLAEVWRECAGHAQQAGVRMAWEFEPGFAWSKPSDVVKMHERVAHPAFHILFDTAHAYMSAVVGARHRGEPERLAGGIVEFLDRLAGRIGALHLIDSDGTLFNEDTSSHVPLGEGLIDWPKLLPHLLAVPGIEWWCLDLCFYPGAWERVEQTLESARGLLALAK